MALVNSSSLEHTGLVLLVPNGNTAGSKLEPGGYRLGWEFRRDEPEPVLSENGDTSAEVTHLDIPWTAGGEGQHGEAFHRSGGW